MNNPYKFFRSYIDDLKNVLKKQSIASISYVSVSPAFDDSSVGTIGINFKHSDKTHFVYFTLLEDGETEFHPSSVCIHEAEDGLITYAQSNIDKEFFRSYLEDWAEYVRNRFYAAERIKDFWEEAKEELVATVWHPERVNKWLETGIDVEDM